MVFRFESCATRFRARRRSPILHVDQVLRGVGVCACGTGIFVRCHRLKVITVVGAAFRHLPKIGVRHGAERRGFRVGIPRVSEAAGGAADKACAVFCAVEGSVVNHVRGTVLQGGHAFCRTIARQGGLRHG